MRSKLWYIAAFAAFALLPLAGCSGGGSGPTKLTEKGTELTVSGKVTGSTAAKTTAKTAIAANTVEVYNAQDGATLGSGIVAADGNFTGLTLTLASTKTVLVFKATVAQGTFLSVVPIDLSNPPPAGTVTGANQISIVIGQESTATAQLVSQLLGLTGDLGDAGQTLTSVNKTYADAAQLVVNNGGQQLAYGGPSLSLNLSGKFSSAALLPALDASNLDGSELNNMILDGSITSVAIPGSKPIVSFQVVNKATGKGVRGLKTFNIVIAQLKPGVTGAPSEWLSYMVTATSRPTTDVASNPTANPPVVGYTVIDNGDGSYTVVFAKDIKTTTGPTVTYDANLTHRIMVGIRTTPSVVTQQNGVNLSNFYNEKYFIKDFIPATPAVLPTEMRDMTTTDSCNECHGKIGVTTPHGGRGDVKYCMMCHTSQRAIGRTNLTSTGGVIPARDPLLSATSANDNFVADGEVFGDFVTMIHKIHMGSKLSKTGYDYAGVLFNNIVYPKGIDNCRQCHKGDTTAQLALAPQANNWKEKPSRKSCGSCHDNINFATGANAKLGGAPHGIYTNDSACVSCHGTAGPFPVETFHASENATVNNPNTPAGLNNFYYEVSSATVDAATNNLSIKFRIQQNTGSLTAAKTNVVFDGTATNPLIGYTGGPTFLLAYYQNSANQPFATNSADYNNLGVKAAQPKTVSIGSLLGGTTGTLGAADASGFYTAVVNSAAAFPVGSTLRAVGLQGYFTQVSPAAARHALSAVKPVTGDAVRREVIDSTKCGNCHEWFEGHGGNRVAGLGTVGQSICTLCHVPNLTSSGRGIQQSLLLFVANNPVGTSLAAVTNFLSTANPQASFSGTVSAGAQAANIALIAALGDNPTLYPEVSNNFKDMIHGVHAGSNSLVVGTSLQFVRDRGTSGEFDYNFDFVTFPGVLKDCRACHKDFPVSATNPAVDASKATYISIPAGVQSSTQVTTTGVPLTLQTAFPASVANGNNVTQVDLDRKSLPNAQDLVNTPFTATCKACHSRPNALAHFKSMGGSVNVPRASADPNAEACVTCHGTTGPNAIWNVHRFSVVSED